MKLARRFAFGRSPVAISLMLGADPEMYLFYLLSASAS